MVRGVIANIKGAALVGVVGMRSARSGSDGGLVDDESSPSSENRDALDGVTEGGISTGARSNAAASWSFRIVISSLASTTRVQSRVMHERNGSYTSKFIFETLRLLFDIRFVE